MHRLLKRKKPAGPPVDRCPHKVRPPVGCFVANEPSGVCTRCDVLVSVDNLVATTTISAQFTGTAPQCDIVFPVSEFGRARELKVTVNGTEVSGGTLWRRGYDNSIWFSTQDAEFTTAVDSTPQSSGPAPLYCYRAMGVAMGAGGKADRGCRLVFTVTTEVLVDKNGIRDYALPFTCCPRAPASVTFRVQNMPTTIRAIWSPNKANRVNPIIRGKRAEVAVEIDPSKGAQVEDYLFILHVELGEPIRPECADPVALLIMVSTVASLVLFSLTHTLDPEY